MLSRVGRTLQTLGPNTVSLLEPEAIAPKRGAGPAEAPQLTVAVPALAPSQSHSPAIVSGTPLSRQLAPPLTPGASFDFESSLNISVGLRVYLTNIFFGFSFSFRLSFTHPDSSLSTPMTDGLVPRCSVPAQHRKEADSEAIVGSRPPRAQPRARPQEPARLFTVQSSPS